MADPGLSVVTAPRLEPLLGRLADVLGGEPLPPLEPETVLVAQNKGLRAWLTKALAERLGCAAALDLRAPLSFATDLARDLVPDARPPEGERHPFDAAPLAWRLAPLLDDLGDDPTADPLRAYLDRTGGQTMPLAKRLAALFDDYQVYRPDVLAAWARGEDPVPEFSHGAWQASLWRRLVADVPGTLDRAAGLEALIEHLHEREPGSLSGRLPTRISVFGALLFPPLYLRVLHAASRHVPVTLYAVTPGDATGDGTHAHPLLRALAGRSRDYGAVLHDLGADDRQRLADPTAALGDAAPPALHQLQAALATDTPPARPVPLDPDDPSIRVHDAHSPTRELETLRDALLDAFAEVEGLRPSDVLVLVPDLATYAPLVDAVFGAEDAAPDLRIPYHVVDHPHAPALRVVEAFGRALRLHDGRVTASELLDLLGTPVVRRAAGIAEDELPRLRTWIREAGVCWGLTAERKGRFGLPEDDLHTWRFGLDRLLLGVMTGAPAPTGDGLVLGHLPCDVVGDGGADLLGRFCEWAEALFAALDAIDRPATLDAWPARLVDFLDRAFLAQDDEEIEAVVFLRQQALELAHLHGLAGRPADEVSFRTVRAHLDGAAGRLEQREPVLTGRLTVADPQVLRHAPHRVVAVLGLNDGVWPRPETPPGFDLIAHAPQPGDADPRGFQKQLFLDAVLAARDRLILSYVGRSQKDNAERAASVCLDAFLDAAHRHWGDDACQLVVTHRLQPFAADYFGGTPGGDGAPVVGRPRPSYAAQHLVGTANPPRPFLDAAERLPADAVTTTHDLPLTELAEAWTNPSRFVVRRRLRADLDLDDDALSDDEPVMLGGLEKWKVRQAVLDGLLDGLTEAEIEARLLRCGLLPAGAPGPSWVRQAREEVGPMAETILAWGETAPRSVDVEIAGVRLVGTVPKVHVERGALRYRAGTVRQKDLITAWIDHLALAATFPLAVECTCTIGIEKTAHFAPVEAAHAQAYLAALVRGWRRAQRYSIPLYEHASYAYANELSDGDLAQYAERVRSEGRSSDPFQPPSGAMKKARSAFSPFKGRPDPPPGDDDDAYVLLATRGRTNAEGEPDPFVPEEHFMKWSLGLWAPLLHYHREGTPS